MPRVYATPEYLDKLRSMGMPTGGEPQPNLGMESALEAAISPIEVGKGALYDVGVGVIQGIGQLMKAPFAPGKETSDRVYDVANLLTLGIVDLVKESYASTYNPAEPGSTISYDEGTWNLFKALVPVDAAKLLLTGRDSNGKQLKPREWGSLAMSTALQVIPIAKGAGMLKNAIFKNVGTVAQRGVASIAAMEKGLAEQTGKLGKLNFNETIITERAMAREFRANNPHLIKVVDELKEKFGIEATVADVLDITKRAGVNILKDADDTLSPTQIREIAGESKKYLDDLAKNNPEALDNLIMETAIRVAAKGGKERKMDFLANMIAHGGIAPEKVGEIFKEQMSRYGMTPGDVAQNLERVGDLIVQSGTRAGRTLNVISKLAVDSVDTFVGDNPQVKAAIRALKAQLKEQGESMSRYDTITAGYRRWLKWARSNAVGQQATIMRNNITQGAEATTKMFETALGDVRIYGESVLRGKPMPVSEAFAQSRLSMVNAVHHLSAQVTHGKDMARYVRLRLGRKTGPNTFEQVRTPISGYKSLYSTYDEIMKAIDPAAKILLEDSVISDIYTRSIFDASYRHEMKSMMKSKDYSKAEKVAGALDFWSDIVTATNRLTEMEWRRYFFMDNIIKETRSLGYKTLNDYVAAVKSGDINVRKSWIGGFRSEAEATKRLVDVKSGLGTIVDEYVDKNTRVLQARLKDKNGVMAKTLDDIKKEHVNDWAAEINNAIDRMADGTPMEEALSKLPEPLIKHVGGVIEGHDTAITRSIDRALMSTFAYTPTQGGMAAILKIYHDFPYAAGLGPYFPRFLTNMWTWIGEHEPIMRAEEVTAFVGAKARAIEKGSFVGVNRRAIDVWAKRRDGMLLAGLANFTRDTVGGPKYYQVWSGTTDKEGNKVWFDMRPMQPFSQLLFLFDMIKNIGEGRPPNANLTAAEVTDALVGVRRLQETPIFAFPDVIRMLDAEDSTSLTRSIKRIIGAPASMPFTPLRTLIDFMASAGIGEGYDDVKELMTNELFGPAMQNIPGVRDNLPSQIDPFTGKTMENQSPALRQVLGASLSSYTPLQISMQEAGMGISDLTGSYKTLEANTAVRKNIGALLSLKMENGMTMNQSIAEGVKRATSKLPIGYRKELLRDILGSLRGAAVNLSMAENPRAFAQEQISRTVPEPFRKGFRQKLEELGHQSKPPTHPFFGKK